MDHQKIAKILSLALGNAAEAISFEPLLDGIRQSLELSGIHADRIQLPMSRNGGFRHPTLGLVLLTWSKERGFQDTELMSHDQLNALVVHGVVGTRHSTAHAHGRATADEHCQ